MPLDVIGAGLGRTGTMSLKFALEHLGFGPCHHMIEVISNPHDQLPKWLGVLAGNPDWEAIFSGYRSAVDYPACMYWRALAARYPEAKLILTVRDADSWAASVSETIFSTQSRAIMNQPEMNAFFDGVVHAEVEGHSEDRAWLADYFRRWNAAVIAEAPADRLLVFEAKQGWEPLCSFLGVPVPAEPYPRVNSREEMVARFSPEAAAARARAVAEGVVPSLDQIAAMAGGRLAMMREKAFPKGAEG
jgi:hypothetical protein